MGVCFLIGGIVTVMGQDGKPVQVSAAALQAGTAQNALGIYTHWRKTYFICYLNCVSVVACVNVKNIFKFNGDTKACPNIIAP